MLLFNASLWPRENWNKRGADKATMQAVNAFLAGKDWPEIYRMIWPDRELTANTRMTTVERATYDRWRKERERLNTNAKKQLKKMMRHEGAPTSQSVTVWRATRLKNQHLADRPRTP
jgi:hypothetical protein